jgi:hypothetical protein
MCHNVASINSQAYQASHIVTLPNQPIDQSTEAPPKGSKDASTYRQLHFDWIWCRCRCCQMMMEVIVEHHR